MRNRKTYEFALELAEDYESQNCHVIPGSLSEPFDFVARKYADTKLVRVERVTLAETPVQLMRAKHELDDLCGEQRRHPEETVGGIIVGLNVPRNVASTFARHMGYQNMNGSIARVQWAYENGVLLFGYTQIAAPRIVNSKILVGI